jgi:hypothetical protein
MVGFGERGFAMFPYASMCLVNSVTISVKKYYTETITNRFNRKVYKTIVLL